MAKLRKSAPFRPTHVGVRFGPDERDLMAVWLADSADPAPAVLCFHPGRFRKLARPGPVRTAPPVVRRDLLALVDAGISIVAPSHHGAGRTPFEGAARALQFVRSQAGEWNLDKERIAAMGTSSGACLSLWLASHTDPADPASEDPLDAPYGIHHPSFGVAWRERIEAVGGRCDLVARRRPVADSRARSIPAFLLDELKGPGSG